MSHAPFEIRDAVHNFIHLDALERRVIDSDPFQRLRHVHQLALSYLVYPGASHKRFEHSLGAMEIAGRIYDVVTRPDKLSDDVRDVVPPQGSLDHAYSRSLLRIAALCHDTGHLPFSHAAEDELLPDGWDHERITYTILQSQEMAAVWRSLRPQPNPDDLAKIALGPRKLEKLNLDLRFTTWDAILAEMVVGDCFGADRIDYLLRDSLHTGVAYGRFDHHRLVETLRIVPAAPSARNEASTGADSTAELGIERGGLEAAESLLLARYFMFSQVYFHPARLIYDQHLKDFLQAWLPGGVFPTDVAGHLQLTDAEICAELHRAARDRGAPGHDAARRIVERDHFRVVYQRGARDTAATVRALFDAARERWGEENVRYGGSPMGGSADFPVREPDGASVSALSLSPVLNEIPVSRNEYVYAAPQLRDEARAWLRRERGRIVAEAVERQATTDLDKQKREVTS